MTTEARGPSGSRAPATCGYCDGHGNSSAGGACGFCVDGKPLDTQEDWDKSWGKAIELLREYGWDGKNLVRPAAVQAFLDEHDRSQS